MAYDEGLAQRIREQIEGTPNLAEKKMFGGLGFMVGGHMAVSAYKGGDLMIHCGKEESAAYIREPGARPMERGGKAMKGWVIVSADAVEEDADLAKWVCRGRDYAMAQPPK